MKSIRFLSSIIFLICFCGIALSQDECAVFCEKLYVGASELKACNAGCEFGAKQLVQTEIGGAPHNASGILKGTITWQYNQYVGTKPDTGAIMYLFPKQPKTLIHDDEIEMFDKIILDKKDVTDVINQIQDKYGIYIAFADGYGHYEIQGIVPGEYMALIVSNKTKWPLDTFDQEETELNSFVSTYMDSSVQKYLVSRYLRGVYKTEDISSLSITDKQKCEEAFKTMLASQFNSLNKYILKQTVVISPDKTTDISYDFGNTGW